MSTIHKDLFGCITKVENLWCLEDLGIKNTCILESLNAFPGYYGGEPEFSKPMFIYIVAGETYTMEDIVRISKKVKMQFPLHFSAAYTRISMNHASCCAVRISGIKSYDHIFALQQCYRDQGLVLKRKVKDIDNSEALIQIYRFFTLNEIETGLYVNAEDTDIGFFRIERVVEWTQFAASINLLRSNCSGKLFDAAKSFVYRNAEIVDLVRIYSKNNSLDLLKTLQQKYLSLFES